MDRPGHRRADRTPPGDTRRPDGRALVDDLLGRAVARTPLRFAPGQANSGAALEAVALADGTRLVVKRFSAADDLLMRLTHDAGRAAALWTGDAFDRLPPAIDHAPRALDYQAELGNDQFGCDIEFFPYGDRDYVLRRAELFNSVGELARARGMRFYYHNHFQEFQRVGDDYVYDLILDNTDPDLVKLEIDTYWMYRGGQDPIEWMRKCADRVILVHQKDFPAAAPQPLNLFEGVVSPTENIDLAVFQERKDERCFTEIGTGVLPIQSILDAAGALPTLDCLILEQDHTALDEIESVRASRHAFASNFTGISWS